MSRSTIRSAAAEIAVDATLPRPAQFRSEPLFRETVERVDAALQAAIAGAQP